jgi:hypothetical protein
LFWGLGKIQKQQLNVFMGKLSSAEDFEYNNSNKGHATIAPKIRRKVV